MTGPERDSSQKRLAAPRGSYEAQRWLAAELADEAAAEAAEHPRPQLATLAAHVMGAFDAAWKVAHQSRVDSTPAQDFIAQQVRLAEHVTRARAIQTAFADWPQTPGMSISWRAGGSSALQTAFMFADMINTAMMFARGVDGHGKTPYDPLPVHPTPDPRFADWRARAMTELHAHTLPAPPAWPAWEIHRDAGILRSHVAAEWERLAPPADDRSGPNVTPPLTTKQIAEMAGCSPDNVRRAMRGGGLKAIEPKGGVKGRKSYRAYLSVVRQWISTGQPEKG